MFFCPFISERFIVELTVCCLSLNNCCTWFVSVLFSFQRSSSLTAFLRDNYLILPKLFWLVNTFWKVFSFFFSLVRDLPFWVLYYLIKSYQSCQLFFLFFVFFYFWELLLEVIRGIFTLFMAYFRPFTVYRIFICFFTLYLVTR